jgi:hypothetical protein
MDKIFTHIENKSLRYSLINIFPNKKGFDQWGSFIDLSSGVIKNLPIKSLTFIGVLSNDEFISSSDYFYMAKLKT